MLSSYLAVFRGPNRSVRLYMVSAAIVGLTTYGGIYATLSNLFLVRLGYGPEFIGLVNAVGSVGWAVFCLPIGWLGTRWGPRRVMIAGLVALSLSNALMPLAGLIPRGWDAPWLVGVNVIGAAGMAAFIVESNPFLMAASSFEERRHVYAAASAVWPLSAFVGGILAGVMPGLYAAATGVPLTEVAPYRFPLLVAAALTVPAVLVMQGTEQTPRFVSRPSASAGASGPPRAAAGRLPLGLIMILTLALSLQVCSEASVRTFFNVYLDTGLGVPTVQIGLLMAISQVVAVLPVLAMPALLMRLGNGRAFVWTSLAVAATLVPMALVARVGVAALAYVGTIALAFMARPAIQMYQMEAVKPAWRNAMAGTTAAGTGLGWAVVGLGGGFLIMARGYPSMFLAAAGLTALGALVFQAHLWARGRRDGSKAPRVDEMEPL